MLPFCALGALGGRSCDAAGSAKGMKIVKAKAAANVIFMGTTFSDQPDSHLRLTKQHSIK
jgi:hypothetical protein